MERETRSLLERVPIFAGLQVEVLQDLEAHGHWREVADGEWMVREGESGREMFILTQGEAEVVIHSGTSQEVVLARLKSGDFFGEMCLIECMPRAASVRACGRVRLLSLPVSELHHVFQLWPEQYAILILNIARDLSRRLRAMDRHFAERRLVSGGPQ